MNVFIPNGGKEGKKSLRGRDGKETVRGTVRGTRLKREPMLLWVKKNLLKVCSPKHLLTSSLHWVNINRKSERCALFGSSVELFPWFAFVFPRREVASSALNLVSFDIDPEAKVKASHWLPLQMIFLINQITCPIRSSDKINYVNPKQLSDSIYVS